MASYYNYKPGQGVTDAWKYYQQVNNSRPGAYQSSWQDELDKLYKQIAERKPFQYDLNADSLYHQYKDQYTLGGQQAMMDTMGQASALTGGYGNSYAQTAGQQTYQGYMQKLNEVIPQLEDRAYGRYRDEGQDLYNLYGLTQGNDDRDYGRYRDQVGDWQADRGFAYGAWNDERGFDYGAYQDDLQQQNWQAQFDYNKAQDDYQKQQAAAAAARSGRGGSGGGRTGNDTIDLNFTQDQINGAADAWKSGGENGLDQYIASLILQGISPAAGAALRGYIIKYIQLDQQQQQGLTGGAGGPRTMPTAHLN